MRTLLVVILGVGFGYALSRSGAADYNFIQGMFLLENFQVYGIIGTAVVIGVPGMWLLKRHGKAMGGAPLAVKAKPHHLGNVVGGVLFGVGWAMTGMCPGPILVNIGEGKLYALAAFAGVVTGTYLMALSYPRMSKPLGMPPLPEKSSS